MSLFVDISYVLMYMSHMNTSLVEDDKTAKTRVSCAFQRAENLFCLGSKNVIELCVGPSLQSLEKAYRSFGIEVTGNDIEDRWQKFYPQGKWIIDDARNVNTEGFDTVVFAPPLSKGCSGTREDSLSIDQVFPSYYDFLESKAKTLVLVLPGRTLSVKDDRKQLHKLLGVMQATNKWKTLEIVPLVDKVTKYVDIYATRA